MEEIVIEVKTTVENEKMVQKIEEEIRQILKNHGAKHSMIEVIAKGKD